jgi:tRNA 2-thiouridine synthesizing protein A
MSDAAERIDVSGLRCPMTWVHTRLALERLQAGQVLEVVLGPGEMLRNIPRNARDEGHGVEEPAPFPGDRHLLRVRKGGSSA